MKVVKAYKNFYNYVAIGNAMMSRQGANDSQFTKLIKQGAYGAYYLVNKKRRIDQQELMNANPDLNLARELWNMLENKLIMKSMEMVVMPSVKVNKKIIVPMMDIIFTRENIA